MVCFVILHYMAKEETISCVENLQRLEGEKQIVIVDNGSPNHTGKALYQYYNDTKNVDVILNSENMGFARGNNVGYEYARKRYAPEFIVVLNNDIHIEQNNFISMLQQVYREEEFAVLGPDVYIKTMNLHQNPKRLTTYSYGEVQALIKKYEKRCKSKLVTEIKCFLKKLKGLKRAVYESRIKKNAIDYKVIYYNIPLHGSCLIFSKRYTDHHKKCFFEGTFMYYESEILDYECHRDGLKTMYSPELQVLHNHNVSTNATYQSSIKRTMFMNECILSSLIAFGELMERDKNNE